MTNTNQKDLIDRLGETAQECKALIREMHECYQTLKTALKDMNGAIERANSAKSDLENIVDITVSAELLDQILEHTREEARLLDKRIAVNLENKTNRVLKEYTKFLGELDEVEDRQRIQWETFQQNIQVLETWHDEIEGMRADKDDLAGELHTLLEVAQTEGKIWVIPEGMFGLGAALEIWAKYEKKLGEEDRVLVQEAPSVRSSDRQHEIRFFRGDKDGLPEFEAASLERKGFTAVEPGTLLKVARPGWVGHVLEDSDD